ncbi:MAG: galactokinase [Tenericutes bacterium GWC2_34_14]|nr:MAG: galactokinase [Tenericutes bacterium GWC2_34_14]OHE33508.1 MAG: galactokinase [Tenericutes bacterium GWE2_34_108]OHE36793.1 MAG: galactokinase [Tenericutes bacterium GWF1_35_14]OHE38127.1 MAG: galactokinase [Tenericutes bacterium GWF2_35_184]OHE42149.1 MAG: galactokinase [Tenericutes bacterium RIFOXYA12_FULL_35_10]OHE43356.1 MAG: galactokinase [Tenericutes bacterium RIFOXYA2_FULL_36_32]OHE46726.1 MAG: galactokinase [Tenericutes bacterium RIFOXYB2_FULL_36_25]OHE48274.1 MAG: galactokin
MKTKLIENFKNLFNREDGISFFSPGRVNLIGEHIDYNGGFVFPCALSDGTYGIAGKREDRMIYVYSEPFTKEIYSFSMDHLEKDPHHAWANYIKGSIHALMKHGYDIPFGIDLYMTTTMPLSAGLSSSASLEMLIITLLDHLFHLNISLEDKARLGKYAENKYVGVNSGIMDQFAVVAGKENHALLLNTDTLAYEQIPLELNNYSLLIVNTNKKRGLADSKYNERFSECQTSLSTLQKAYSINYLCELQENDLNKISTLLDPLIFKRTKHVITEQTRTIESAKALKQHDLITFAKLMNQSHQSLKDDYEVTGVELDTLQQALLDAGAVGARMTGAGFGGCVVSIIPTDILDQVIDDVTDVYTKKIGYEPTFYQVKPSDGTHLI